MTLLKQAKALRASLGTALFRGRNSFRGTWHLWTAGGQILPVFNPRFGFARWPRRPERAYMDILKNVTRSG